ncbi:MAG TPA: hypothetical protein VFL86_07905, partial [Burkholderiaceae bacterium]|nr:hypothetical protein [Burkholderiaceae bacterium]
MASVSVARSAVRKLLESSPAYRALPPDKRRDIANNTVRVASYMADPDGLLSKKPPVATARAPKKVTRARGPAAAHLAVLGDPRVLDASAATAALLQQVDFPGFVEGLIQGTFNAIVNASIEQMKAYGKLVEQVAKTVARFKEDNISDAQARDRLVQRFAADLELDPRGRLRWCVAPHAGAKGLASALSMSNPSVDTRDLVTAAKRRMAIDRQQVLSTMVMMGINRVVVT